MKKLILTFFLILTPAVLFAGDFEDGVAALQRKDYEAALNKWRPLAEKGDARAQYNLGVMYASGEGVPQDYKEVLKWLKLAAEQGNAEAQTSLGVMYYKGIGVPKDYNEALRLYKLAAMQQNAVAHFNLGLMYSKGHFNRKGAKTTAD